jgi:hypothetical protein
MTDVAAIFGAIPADPRAGASGFNKVFVRLHTWRHYLCKVVSQDGVMPDAAPQPCSSLGANPGVYPAQTPFALPGDVNRTHGSAAAVHERIYLKLYAFSDYLISERRVRKRTASSR